MRASQQSPELCIEPQSDSPSCTTDTGVGKVDTSAEISDAGQSEPSQAHEESLHLFAATHIPDVPESVLVQDDNLTSTKLLAIGTRTLDLEVSEATPESAGESCVNGSSELKQSADDGELVESNGDAVYQAPMADQVPESKSRDAAEDLMCHEEIEGDDSSTTLVLLPGPKENTETDIGAYKDDLEVLEHAEEFKVKQEADAETLGKDDPSTEQSAEDGVEFCKCCGCYGLASEFYERKYCTKSCHNSWMFASNNSKKLGKADITRKMKLIEYNGNAANVHESDDCDVKMEISQDETKIDVSSNGRVVRKKAASKVNKKKSPLKGGVSGKELTGVKERKIWIKRIKPKDLLLGKMAPICRPEFVSEEFDWQKYLVETKSKAAPLQLFREPQMPPPNPFRVNMLMEAIDPQHQSLICVVSVQELQGYRIKLRFEGFSDSYDFWVNADSYDIFPATWSKEKGLELQPPPGISEPFDWEEYAALHGYEVANRDLFAVTKDDVDPDPDVKPGMKMEAVDMRNQALICVASVAKIMGDRVLVHFDSWDSIYDYWTDFSSPFIFPVGHCGKNNIPLTPPNNCKTDFDWDLYMKETGSIPVPENSFRPLPGIFRRGYKVECVDKRNPYLIRVATIAGVEGNNVVVHFDNWPVAYDYKLYELSPDIHPVGWCAHTGHPLIPPPKSPWKSACSSFGCFGWGHIRGPKYLTHSGEKNCPYSPQNLKRDWILKDRFATIDVHVTGHAIKDNSSSVEPTNSKQQAKSMDQSSTSKASKKLEPKSVRARESRVSSSSTPEASPKRARIDRKSKSSLKSRSPSPPSNSNGHGMTMTTRKSSVRNDLSGAAESAENDHKKIIESKATDLMSLMPSKDIVATSIEVVPRKRKNSSLRKETKKPATTVPWNPNIDAEATPAVCLKTMVGSLQEETVARWKVDQLAGFISKVPGCEHTASTFSDQLIDGESFLMLSQNDFLNVMGLKLGPAIKLCNVIKMISANSDHK